MPIAASVLWRRLDTPGHDACVLEQSGIGWTLRGTAVFRHESGEPAGIVYAVHCDPYWETLSGHVHGTVGGRDVDWRIARSSLTWTVNGHPVPGLEHLVDLDFGFTPATNILPLRRLSPKPGEKVAAPAAWFDLEAPSLVALPQVYERRSDSEVWYESPDTGYSAVLQFLPNGFARSYPGLWEAA